MRSDRCRAAGITFWLPAMVSMGLLLPSCNSAARKEGDSGTVDAQSRPADTRGAQGGATAGPANPAAGRVLRDVRGLPEPLPGYLSWPRLGGKASIPDGVASPHLSAGDPATHERYASIPSPERFKFGKDLPLPLPNETVIVREAFRPADGFVSRLDVMKKAEGGAWEFSAYERSAASQPFGESGGNKAECGACHGKNPQGDFVFAGVELRE